ncbi:MAG: hypothetical protein GX597_26355 [Anaerolineaceae bacterium]|nr:hypothetical protein [Anaerolineaceae bacterium]
MKEISRRLAVLALVTAGAGAILLLAGERPLLVPYWYAVPIFNPPLAKLWPAFIALSVYTLAGFTLAVRSRGAALLWSLLGGIVLPIATLSVLGDPFEVLLMRTISNHATGGFSRSVELTPELVRNWSTYMAGWRTIFPHISISLPGWPLVYAGLVRILEQMPALSQSLAAPLRGLQCHQWGFNTLADVQIASAWLGVLAPLWSALTVLPLFGLARRVAGETVALHVVLLWPLVPAAALFTGTLNSPYPLLATIAVLCLWSGMTRKAGPQSAILLLLSGALSGGLIILSLALVPLLMLCGLLMLGLPWMDRAPARTNIARSVIAGVWFCLGTAVVMAVYGFLAQHSPLHVISVALNVHFELARAYLTGVGLHLWDFIIFTGLPLVMLALMAMTGVLRRNTRLEAPHLLAASLGLTLLVLVLSGTAQGEVGRVWLFFMPLITLLAACGLSRLHSPTRTAFLISQGVWLLALAATTVPVDTWLGPRPSYSEVVSQPLDQPVAQTDARFGDQLRLTGFQAEGTTETGMLTVVLHWDALQQMAEPYYLSAVLVGPDGRVLPGVDWQPFGKLFPTTCWTPQLGTIAERVELPLGVDPPEGDWWLSLTVFSLGREGPPAYLPVTLPDGTHDRQVGIGPLRVDRP